MFFLGRAIEVGEWESVALLDVRAVFADLGLTAAWGRTTGFAAASCRIRSHGIYIASDRFMSDEGVVDGPQKTASTMRSPTPRITIYTRCRRDAHGASAGNRHRVGCCGIDSGTELQSRCMRRILLPGAFCLPNLTAN